MGKSCFLVGFFMVLLLSMDCLAVTYYVDGNIGNDANSGTAVSSAWRTIGKANSVLQAGDTVYIRGGTYTETIIPANSGASGNYITFKNYQNDEAIITGVYDGVDLRNKHYIILDGITILDVSHYWVNMYGADSSHSSTHNIIKNCHMENSKTPGDWAGIYMLYGIEYNKILDNTFIGLYQPADLIYCTGGAHYNLIEGNTFLYGSHSSIDLLSKYGTISRNVIRNNFFWNPYHSELILGRSADWTLVEKNIFLDAGEDKENNIYGSDRDREMVRGDHAAIQHRVSNGIIRNNLLVNNGEFTIGSYDDGNPLTTDNRIYHNTEYKNIRGIYTNSPAASYDNIFKNNILYQNYESGETHSSEIYRSPSRGPEEDYFINNLIYAGPIIVGSLGTTSLPYLQSNYPDYWKDNLGGSSIDPQFTNPGAVETVNSPWNRHLNPEDLHLKSTSPMIDAGTFLTITTTAGNGNTIPVKDASYFYDGWGIEGELGDLIQLEGQSQTARITSIDYANNRITVDKTLIWSSGLGISLPYSGSAPDIGAFEFEETTTECQGTDTSCGNYPDCINCNAYDACSGENYMDYYCAGTSCSYNTDDCTDCSCSCGGYDTAEILSNLNCKDGKDNDCDGNTDNDDLGCQASDIPLDYVSYYAFEGDANDETGTNNGNLVGGATFARDTMKGTILDLRSVGAYVDIGTSFNIETLSISLWIKPLTGHVDCIFLSRGFYRTDGWYLWLRNDSDLATTFNSAGDWSGFLDPQGFFEQDSWNHLIVLITPTKVSHYKNGLLVNEISIPIDWITSSQRNFMIGGYDKEGFDFNGFMDDVMIYDRTLSADEISHIYNSQKPGTCSNSSDTNCDGCVDDVELFSYVGAWKSGSVAMLDLLDAISVWKAGCA